MWLCGSGLGSDTRCVRFVQSVVKGILWCSGYCKLVFGAYGVR